MSPFTESDVRRFWATADRADSGCWVWRNSLACRCYGLFSAKGLKRTTAHRVAFFLEHGRWPLVACHRCNNKACVRPDHIYDGDKSTNALDCVASGTHVQARKTACPLGHPYANGGAVVVRSGRGFKRVCVTCRRKKDIVRKRLERTGWTAKEGA